MIHHIYHYNVHSEKKYFLGRQHHNLYNLISVNGNILSHTPNGVAAFIATAAKDFYIDPQTHAFQHPTISLKRDVSDKKNNETPVFEFKPSIEKLAHERLGFPFNKVISEDRPLTPNDFYTNAGKLDGELIENVCKAIIRFQRKTMVDSLSDEDKEFIGGSVNFLPKFIIAPYFYLASNRFNEWLDLNNSLYTNTKNNETELPVYLSLVLSKQVIDQFSENIIQSVSNLKPDGIVLWIDKLIEEELSEKDVIKYKIFFRDLRNSTSTLMNSHGGYLSILLCHEELGDILDGVGHSINYGESRPVIPIGGGIPMARFYFPNVHSRMRYGDALSIIRINNWLNSKNSFTKNVCRCRQCVDLIDKKTSVDEAFEVYGKSYPVTIRRRTGSIVRLAYPTSEAREVASRHYLYCKAKEFQDVEQKPLSELIDSLDNTFQQIYPSYGSEQLLHLLNWKAVQS